jgi:hypothetical protein
MRTVYKESWKNHETSEKFVLSREYNVKKKTVIKKRPFEANI